jgi:hypothetical protein
MENKKINGNILCLFFRIPSLFLKISVSLCLCGLFAFSAIAQDLPDKIRGYKVYDAKISVKTESDKTETKGASEAFVKIGEPEIAEISLTGVTLEISAEVSGLEQSGRVDFLTFHDFRVNDLPVKVEEYKESFSFNKNQTVILPKPARIFLETSQVLRGALKERKESNEEWRVTGRVFVFGKFKKFGFSFRRVVPVEINIKIKNPLHQHDSLKKPSVSSFSSKNKQFH